MTQNRLVMVLISAEVVAGEEQPMTKASASASWCSRHQCWKKRISCGTTSIDDEFRHMKQESNTRKKNPVSSINHRLMLRNVFFYGRCGAKWDLNKFIIEVNKCELGVALDCRKLNHRIKSRQQFSINWQLHIDRVVS